MDLQRKNIKVVAAIIREGEKVLATQRGYGNYKDWWEFPGGKVEDGETPQDAFASGQMAPGRYTCCRED